MPQLIRSKYTHGDPENPDQPTIEANSETLAARQAERQKRAEMYAPGRYHLVYQEDFEVRKVTDIMSMLWNGHNRLNLQHAHADRAAQSASSTTRRPL